MSFELSRVVLKIAVTVVPQGFFFHLACFMFQFVCFLVDDYLLFFRHSFCFFLSFVFFLILIIIALSIGFFFYSDSMIFRHHHQLRCYHYYHHYQHFLRLTFAFARRQLRLGPSRSFDPLMKSFLSLPYRPPRCHALPCPPPKVV